MHGESKKPSSVELQYYDPPWQQVNKRQSLNTNPVEVETLMRGYVLSSKNTAAVTEIESEHGKMSIRKHNKLVFSVVH